VHWKIHGGLSLLIDPCQIADLGMAIDIKHLWKLSETHPLYVSDGSEAITAR
jgi:hypothetical protein